METNTLNMILLRTDSNNVDFQSLVQELDKDLAIKNGEMNSFFAQYNKIDHLKQVVVAYINNQAIGCGAIKPYDNDSMEIKRMFVIPEKRGKGVANSILIELHNWAIQLGYTKCILETGDKMTEAINLYQKNGYTKIPNYGQYAKIESSVCFSKDI